MTHHPQSHLCDPRHPLCLCYRLAQAEVRYDRQPEPGELDLPLHLLLLKHWLRMNPPRSQRQEQSQQKLDATDGRKYLFPLGMIVRRDALRDEQESSEPNTVVISPEQTKHMSPVCVLLPTVPPTVRHVRRRNLPPCVPSGVECARFRGFPGYVAQLNVLHKSKTVRIRLTV
jgi:hypothetical protein